MMQRFLAKINKLDPWQAACIIAVIGLCVFFTGLTNPFEGDDTYQIVNNPPVHSIKNIVTFFESSTFYNGAKLSGDYYRPTMTVVFSLLYTLFGPHTVAFHIMQLALYVASAFILYLVFKRFLKPSLALALALIFLVHPLNSQIVYAIPTMQDALFFFFGILGLWLLISDEDRNLWYVAGSLLLAMLSKEAGFIFTFMALLYLIWFDRERIRSFLLTMILPVITYLVLKINAVGINHVQRAAPIDSANLVERLLTMPSIILFYLMKFIFPYKLATGYYWVYSAFSIPHVLAPLVIDVTILGLAVYFGFRIRHKLTKKQFHTYLFFSAWTAVGLVLYLQFIRLDMTACETWFYFAMAGLLGMIGVTLLSVKIRIQAEWLVVPVILLIVIFGVRSAVRGTDYRSQYDLAQHDITNSPGDYAAMGNFSQSLIDRHRYKEAAVYAQRSIDIYPVVSNYNDLGVAREQMGDYTGAAKAYTQALKYNDLNVIYENLGLILIVYSDPATTNKFYQVATSKFPNDFRLRVYLAIFEGASGNTVNAKKDIQIAAKYDSVPPYIYNNIMNDQPFALPLLGKTLVVR